MSRTVIDLDDDLVADVAKALGTNTKKETVNTALREVLESRMSRPGSRPAAGRGGRRRIRSGTVREQGELPPVNAAQFLIDTSALARFMRGEAEQYGWDQPPRPDSSQPARSPSSSSSTAHGQLPTGRAASRTCG